ncbi:MAG: VWA domain-containing protein, partial [Planctomycetota bacterium]
MRLCFWLAILALVALAKPKLKDVFDPREVPLRYWGWDEWRKLSPKEKLASRGIDPETWEKPPPDPEADAEREKKIAEAKKKDPNWKPPNPKDRYAGFKFDKRLARKRRMFDELVANLPASSIEGLIKKLTVIDKMNAAYEKEIGELTEQFLKTKEQLDRTSQQQIDRAIKKTGKPPPQVLVPRNLLMAYERDRKRLQLMLSTQESERQFHDWLLPRYAELIGALSEKEQARPYSALAKGMAHKDWRQRVRCATVLAHLAGKNAAGIFDGAMAAEKDPYVLAELIRLRAKRRPDGLLKMLEGMLADENWQVRATVYAELSRVKKKEAVDLLIARIDKEQGRLQDDIVDALEVLTGKRFDPDTTIWKGYWNKQRASWEPPKEGKREGEKIVKEGGGKSVSFYGIKTHSKRIVFCLDISGSMAEPLDGREGKGDPRIKTAKAQMEKALRSLPDDAFFTIVSYSNTVRTWKKQLVKASSGNKSKAWKWVEKLVPQGSTNIYDALETSLQLAAGKKGVSADTIFFMTDGMPTDGRIVDPSQILAEITQRNRRAGVVIHAIGVSKEQNAGFLLNLARANGGRYA